MSGPNGAMSVLSAQLPSRLFASGRISALGGHYCCLTLCTISLIILPIPEVPHIWEVLLVQYLVGEAEVAHPMR